MMKLKDMGEWLMFVVIAISAGLAYANGANDISKGIATLVGSGVSDYRRAVIWGSAWTALGALLGAVMGEAMLSTFGKGLIAASILPTIEITIGILAGAAVWVMFATRSGLPVSTTHALIGSFIGVVWFYSGASAIIWSTLVYKITIPLLLSPLLALLLTAAVLKVLSNRTTNSALQDCVCIEAFAHPANNALGSMALHSQHAVLPSVYIDDTQQCQQAGSTVILSMDRLHWLTSGLTSMARGMNDAPKIVALIASASVISGANPSSLSMTSLFLIVTMAMLAGSLFSGFRVTECLANKITHLDHREGFIANSIAAALVTTGAIYGMPISTTHVSSGAIIASGLMDNELNKPMLRNLLLAWIITLPASAFIGIMCSTLLVYAL